MPSQNSSHFALRQGNRRGEWATACGRSVRERSLCSLDTADWIVCPECRAAAVAARDAMAEENAGDPDITAGVGRCGLQSHFWTEPAADGDTCECGAWYRFSDRIEAT